MSPAFCMANDCNQNPDPYQKCLVTAMPPQQPPPLTPATVVLSTSTPPPLPLSRGSASPSPSPSPSPSVSPAQSMTLMPPMAMLQAPLQAPPPLNAATALMTRAGSVGGATSAARRNSLWLETLRNTRKLSYANERPILVRTHPQPHGQTLGKIKLKRGKLLEYF